MAKSQIPPCKLSALQHFPDKVVTLKQISQELGRPTSTVRDWINRGVLPSPNYVIQRRLYWTLNSWSHWRSSLNTRGQYK